MIISAFPGTGKTHFFRRIKDIVGISYVSDSDSSLYSWLSPGVRHPNFPSNYIHAIQEHNIPGKITLVSSHKEVRDALIERDMKFVLVYPDKSLREEYILRYEQRGSPEAFIKLINLKWNEWINELDAVDSPLVEKVVLNSGQYISDVIADPIPMCDRHYDS